MPLRFHRFVPLLSSLLLFAGCEENPIDAALDEALDFSGAFESSDGTVIELDGSSYAYVRTVGSTQLVLPLRVGDRYMSGMYETETPGVWRGYVKDDKGWLDWGTVRIAGDRLTITRDNGRPVSGQDEWARTSLPGGTGGGTGSTGGSAGTTVLLYEKNLEGSLRSARRYAVTVPSGSKKLTVQMFEENQYGGNLGDLFVSYGSAPTASHDPYVWKADCASVESNRATETCTFTSPRAGTWHILVYGYHAYYATSLKATIEK